MKRKGPLGSGPFFGANRRLIQPNRVGATHASPSNASPEIDIADDPRARHASPLRSGPPKRSLGAIVGSFKSACTKRINELRGTPGLAVWQRNYHERIIRNDNELHAFREYILNNPARWEEDSEHPQRSVHISWEDDE